MSEYTPYQQKAIKNYYDNLSAVKLQRLGELVTEVYLAEGKKKERAWENAAAAMLKIGVPKSRVDHLLKERKPELLAELVKELEKTKK